MRRCVCYVFSESVASVLPLMAPARLRTESFALARDTSQRGEQSIATVDQVFGQDVARDDTIAIAQCIDQQLVLIGRAGHVRALEGGQQQAKRPAEFLPGA